MKKIQNVLLLLSTFSLLSCTNNNEDSKDSSNSSSPSSSVKEETRSLDEMCQDLEKEISLSGELLMRNYDSTGKLTSSDKGGMAVAFGENSYYLTSNFFNSDITLWRGEDGDAVTYDLDRDNKIVENKFLDSSKEPISFNEYENPFLINYQSYLQKTEGEDSYTLKTTNVTGKNKAKTIMRRVANINLPDISLFKMTYKNGKFDTLLVETPKNQTSEGSGSYDLTITLTFDLSEKDKDIPVPTPLKHESYHDTLMTAFNYLENGKYSYTMEFIDNSGESPLTHYYYEAVDTDFVFQGSLTSKNDDKATMERSYILVNDKEEEGVDKGVHQLLLLDDGSYGYYSTVPQFNSQPITDIKRYTPYRSVAVESFVKQDDGAYLMSTSQTGSLASKITKFTDLDLSATMEIELSLNSDNKISAMYFSSEYYEVHLTYDYSDQSFSKLGFEKKDLQSVDGFRLYAGTYKFKFKNEDVVLVVSGTLKNPKVTWNDVDVTFDGEPYFPTLNQIYFIYGKNSFYLMKTKDEEGNVNYVVGCFDGPDKDETSSIATRS